MTQTSLTGLLDHAYDLAAALGAAMDTVKNHDGPAQPDEWFDLKIAFDAANIAAAQLYQLVKRDRAASQPIPYTLADETDRHWAFIPCHCGTTHTTAETLPLNLAGQ